MRDLRGANSAVPRTRSAKVKPEILRQKVTALAKTFRADAAEVAELVEERAAIREYDGGQKRGNAELAAIVDVAEILARRA